MATTKSRSSATRKPSTGAGRTSSGTTRSAASKAPAANPFKKTADAIKKSQAETTEFAKRTTQAANDATKDAFAYGQGFNQANEWLRNSSEQAQQIFAQAFQNVPGFGGSAPSAFTPAAFTGAQGFDKKTFTNAADTANRSVTEIMSLGSEQLQNISETNSAIANMAKDLSQEVVQSATAIFNDQVELSKAMLACRNVDDVLELQGKASQAALDNFFQESLRLSELAFKYAAEIAEPIQQRFTHVGERLSKINAA